MYPHILVEIAINTYVYAYSIMREIQIWQLPSLMQALFSSKLSSFSSQLHYLTERLGKGFMTKIFPNCIWEGFTQKL